MRTRATFSTLGVLIVTAAAAPLAVRAQTAVRHSYAVKFVCGTRPPQGNERQVPPVAPGAYYTAVNLQNEGRGEASIEVEIAATDEQPVPGPVVSAPLLKLPPGRALELDCGEILRVQHRGPFLKGFVKLASSEPLEVVAVYTAANRGGVASIDVERYPAQRSSGEVCPDLTFGRVSAPAVEATKTTITFEVVNQGTAASGEFTVRVEDPSNPNANRVAETTVSSLGPGETRTVQLVLPYAVAPPALPGLVLQVDPKNLVAECREDNNRRAVGGP